MVSDGLPAGRTGYFAVGASGLAQTHNSRPSPMAMSTA